jgi:hypothetical protein
MKYQCDIPGFEDCYVELSQHWTRGQLTKFFTVTGADYLDLIRSKITAIYLRTETGAIEQPEQLTIDASDDVDIWLWKWFGTAVAVGVDELYSMGEAHARRWSGEYAKQMDERRAKAKLN